MIQTDTRPKWQKVKDFFNTKKSNKVFTRAEYFAYLQENKDYVGTPDQYRLLLEKAGFLKIIEPGVYRKLKPIPTSLSVKAARKLAKYKGYV